MTTSTAARPAVSDDRPGLIHARPVRHPGRWVAIAVIAVLVLMFLNMVIFNPAFNWPLVFQAMNQSPVIEGFWKGTILVTILSMIFQSKGTPIDKPAVKRTPSAPMIVSST